MLKQLSSSTPTARKKHICDWCGKYISKGEKYHNSTNIFDGDIYNWKSHIDCMEVTNILDMFRDCDSDGLSSDDFIMCVYEGYNRIFSELYSEVHESVDYRIPDTTDMIKFIIENYKKVNL